MVLLLIDEEKRRKQKVVPTGESQFRNWFAFPFAFTYPRRNPPPYPGHQCNLRYAFVFIPLLLLVMIHKASPFHLPIDNTTCQNRNTKLTKVYLFSQERSLMNSTMCTLGTLFLLPSSYFICLKLFSFYLSFFMGQVFFHVLPFALIIFSSN